MGKLTSISDDWWDEIENIKMHPFAKVLYFYLKTGHRSISGIFKRSVDEITFKTGVAAGDAHFLLTSGAVKNVLFDEKCSVVFVQDKFASCIKAGGARDLLAVSVLNDYHSTSQARELWLAWRTINAAFIAESASLSEHFALLDRVQVVSLRVNGSKRVSKNVTTEDAETDIQRHLARYTGELDTSSADVVLSAYEKVCAGATAKARLQFLKRIEQFDIDAIVQHCAAWLSDEFSQKHISRSAFVTELERPLRLQRKEG